MAGEEKEGKYPPAAAWAIGIALGLGVGIALGAALGNIGVGIALGAGIGVAFAIAFGAAASNRTRRPKDVGQPESPDDDRDGPAQPPDVER